jgi:endonuclease III
MSLSTDTALPMNTVQRQVFFARLRDANPHPKTELEYRTPFELLIAVLLSAQSTDISVNKATRALFLAANTPAAMLELGVIGIEYHIKTIGLFHSKAKHIIATCELLISQHDSKVPENRAALEALPGVGRKTANVVLNTAFGWPVMAVDTHVFRVANRTGLAPANTVLMVESQLMKRIPSDFLRDAHHWLILHGRYVCKAKKPKCQSCIVLDVCRFKRKTSDLSDC